MNTDYLSPFVSILIGLAVADLSISLHRLLRARLRVTWDWLPLLAALLALSSVVTFWWQFPLLAREELWSRFGPFLIVLVALVLLVLLGSAALPDEVPEDGLNLRAYYLENRRYFWTLYALFMLTLVLIQVLGATNRGVPWNRIMVGIGPNVLIAIAYGALAATANRLVHAVLVPLLFVLLTLNWFQIAAGTAPATRQTACVQSRPLASLPQGTVASWSAS